MYQYYDVYYESDKNIFYFFARFRDNLFTENQLHPLLSSLFITRFSLSRSLSEMNMLVSCTNNSHFGSNNTNTSGLFYDVHFMGYGVHNFGARSALSCQISPRNKNHLCPLLKYSINLFFH